MSDAFRKLVIMVNDGTPLEEIKAFHFAHFREVVNEIIDSRSTPERVAAFEAELNALIKATREANGLPLVVK